LHLFFVIFEQQRKAGNALLTLGDAVRETSKADLSRNMEETPPRAET
jgi:hypothetical protein